MTTELFPALSNWAPTRDTLNLYARAVGVVPRALAKPHPKWWHISLKVRDEGAATDAISLPGSDDASVQLLMNLKTHSVDILSTGGQLRSLSMADGLTATEMGNEIVAAVRDLGVEADFDRTIFENDEPRSYDPEAAGIYRVIWQSTAAVLERRRSALEGPTGPVQLWPHNFDLVFEWFGSLMISSEGGESPSQINFGLAPGDSSHPETYFYSNPWPFQDSLIGQPLPGGARWFTESWKGTLLSYAAVASHESGTELLASYFKTVYELASPLLTA